jgi:hypothetical protein
MHRDRIRIGLLGLRILKRQNIATLAHYLLDRNELLQRVNDLFDWTANDKL